MTVTNIDMGRSLGRSVTLNISMMNNIDGRLCRRCNYVLLLLQICSVENNEAALFHFPHQKIEICTHKLRDLCCTRSDTGFKLSFVQFCRVTVDNGLYSLSSLI